MKYTKFLAVLSSALIISALPFSVNANENETENDTSYIEYRIAEGKAIITNVVTDSKFYQVPEIVTDDKRTYEIIGIDDFAFGACENLEVICVPDTLTYINTGNVAFMTTKTLMNHISSEIGDAATIDDIVRYVAVKANYKNGNFTDADLAQLAIKLNNKLNMIDISAANTVAGKLMILLRNVDKMNINDNLLNYLDIWIASTTYNGLTICGNDGSEMQEYANGRAFLGMIYQVHTPPEPEYLIGDANGDGQFNVRDAAFVATNVAKGVEINTSENPAADYNIDGTVNVRDAAAMARDLSSANK